MNSVYVLIVGGMDPLIAVRAWRRSAFCRSTACDPMRVVLGKGVAQQSRNRKKAANSIQRKETQRQRRKEIERRNPRNNGSDKSVVSLSSGVSGSRTRLKCRPLMIAALMGCRPLTVAAL